MLFIFLCSCLFSFIGLFFDRCLCVLQRMGLLEALEAVVNDDIRMVTQLLDSDREFNE